MNNDQSRKRILDSLRPPLSENRRTTPKSQEVNIPPHFRDEHRKPDEDLFRLFEQQCRLNHINLVTVKQAGEVKQVCSEIMEKHGCEKIHVFLPEKGEHGDPLCSLGKLLNESDQEKYIHHKTVLEAPGLKDLLAAAQCVLTTTDWLVADCGGFLVSSRQPGGRLATLLAPHHMVIAKKNSLYANLETALFSALETHGPENASGLILINGPSRTADIEKTLVLGVHGPVSVTIILIE